MHAAGTGFNHRFHEFKSIQYTTKAGFCVSDNWNEIINVAAAAGRLDFIGTYECVVDSADHGRHRIDRV